MFKNRDRLGGEVVKRLSQVPEVAGSILDRVIPNTFKMVVIAAVLGAQCCGVSIPTDWLVSG